MAELPITDFTYSLIQRLLQEARYDQAISALSQRIETQPQDRMARLLLLLAYVSQFGTSPFNRQIEELRFLPDLSSNERHIVRRIFLVCFQHAERDGQTIQKIVYQQLIRRLMLNQPLDLSISEAREIEQSEETPSTSVAPAALTWSATKASAAEPEPLPDAPQRFDRWDEYALVGAGAMIVIVLLGFYVMNGRRTPFAQNPAQPISLVSGDSESEITADRARPVVTLAPTLTAEPTRARLLSQLGGLNKAYARWTDADPATSGTVSLKLKVEPAGKVTKVVEVVSRLSEHRFLNVVVTEAKLWKLPHGGTSAAEITIPLIFNPRAIAPAQQATGVKTHEPALRREELAATHTRFTLEEAEPPAAELPTVAKNDTTIKPHTTHGRLERADETEIAAMPKASDDSLAKAAVKSELAAASTIAETGTEMARTAALKHEPRFAADAVEKVGLGTRVMVLRKERDWIKVKVQTSGNIGYLRKEYLAAFNTYR